MAKTKRKVNYSVLVLSFVSVFLLSALVFNIVKYGYTRYQLEREKTNKENQYLELQEESEYLKNEIVKLQDPEYLAKYARENYSYSKDGELVIKINGEELVDEEELSDVSRMASLKEYAALGIIFFVGITIIIYMISVKREKS